MKRAIIFKVLIIVLITFVISSCRNKNDQTTTADIKGYVQKGPFISGSSVLAFTLNNDLSQTGMSYSTQITNNIGSFDLGTLTLNSEYVCLRADGYYYNEVSGKQSASQLTLYALSNISDKENINVNILTHLEKPRIEYLMKNGYSFDEAKSQAQRDVLDIFNINDEPKITSEEMNILKGGNDNAALLAISTILQGYRSESELTELLSNISTDIAGDGTLDDDDLVSELVNQAFYLDTTKIKSNLLARSEDYGEETELPSFGKYITAFLDGKNLDDVTSLVKYPETGSYGKNVLCLTGTQYNSGFENCYSLSAEIPADVTLKVIITSLSADTIDIPASDTTSATQQITYKVWYYEVGTQQNWSITDYDFDEGTQTFTAIGSGITTDLKIFLEPGKFQIDYYEMNATIPTRKRVITVI